MTNRHSKAALAYGFALTLGACSAPDSETNVSDESDLTTGVEASAERGVFASPGPWTATAPGGSEVTISGPEHPIRAGSVSWTIDVSGADAVSVDLVSPTMPMHGLLRVPVTAGRLDLEIPMEGRWSVTVNFDDLGAESAEFLFDVAPSEGARRPEAGTDEPFGPLDPR